MAPVLGHQSDPGLHGRERLAVRQLCAVDPHRPRGPSVNPEDSPGDLGTARPDQSGQGDDLPAAHLEGDVVEHADAAQFLHIQDHLTGFSGGLGEQRVQVAAHHGPDDVVDGHVLDRGGADSVAVTHDRHPLTAREGLLQPVGDEQHGRALGAQCPDHVEQPLHLDGRQSGGRLVHHQNPCIERQCLGDLHDLLVCDRKAACRPFRVQMHTEPREYLRGFTVHRAVIDPPPGAQRLAAHEDVLGDAEVGKQRRLLVDDRDTRRVSRRRPLEGHRLPIYQQLTAVGAVHARENLYQGRLARAVLAEQGMGLAGEQRE